jgi:nitrous oxidase accessory protein NosD
MLRRVHSSRFNRPTLLLWLASLALIVGMTLAGCSWKDGGEGVRNPVGPQGPADPLDPPDPSPCITVPDDVATIQQAIDSLPLEGGTVRVRAGTYVVAQGIHVNRSNVTILGEQGVVVRLGEHVNQPVFLIGTDEEIASTVTENIRISEMQIDGNKDFQDSETDPARPWIRNNGIDVRMVRDLRIDNVDIHHARSGGVVVAWKSRRIFISNSCFHHNFFDGIALYDSEDIQVSNFICYENEAAGLSMDSELRHVLFDNGSVKNNGDVGVFARDSEDLSFHSLLIFGSASDGCFLSHATLGTDTGVKRLFFLGCSFIDNGRYGFWLASPASESPDNAVIGCLFSGNASGAIEVHPDGELNQEANIFLPCSGVFSPSF